MKITDRHRSMIASAFVAAFNSRAADQAENRRRSLCCSSDSHDACAAIVGKAKAEKLQEFFWERLVCCGWADGEYHELQEQYFLDKIAALETL